MQTVKRIICYDVPKIKSICVGTGGTTPGANEHVREDLDILRARWNRYDGRPVSLSLNMNETPVHKSMPSDEAGIHFHETKNSFDPNYCKTFSGS
ncbi:MAG: hypothetical protein JST47_16375 [Bacteroidetes bacterium]|nr:hypothetical protein [Bacteroidota bacterium]MBS1974988.1 hypothetical protein [Bacteroidota bacterium]